MRERNYQICRLLLLTDVIHYLDTSVAYRIKIVNVQIAALGCLPLVLLVTV